MTENNFEEMTKKALGNIDETITKSPAETEVKHPYMLTQDLLDDGNMFDNTGVYFHFKEEFQVTGLMDDSSDMATRDDIYLFIERNPDKKLEINCKWATKTEDGFNKARGFRLDFLLDIGDEKDLKALNKKVAFSGSKNENPASKGTYVEFVEHITDSISKADCLEVFKEQDFEFPAIAEDEPAEDVEASAVPQTFVDYSEKVQHEALQILKDGSLFEEIQNSVALTHEGHATTRNALILMEASLFVDDGAHGLIGGESGKGKTDIVLTTANNLPAKYVHVISSNSPKHIFYDFENYDDNFNVVIFDDIVFNEEIIALCKLMTDNRVKEKVHRTVINGKPAIFKLKGKYLVFMTYAKDMPDEELANRLFNIGVNIVEKDESEDKVKLKIRDNHIIKSDENLLIEGIREPIRAAIQFLIEQNAQVYNPFLTVFDPLNFNNRDINHLASMTNAKTFFELNKREHININDETALTIGSLEDLVFVHEIWATDSEAQKYKLSELQKNCLELLPELTDEEAFKYIEKLNESLKNAESRAYRKKILDDEPLLKSLSKKLQVNPSTLKNALDKFYNGNKKSLCEMGLADKIQLNEENIKSPNFYYKIKKDGASLNSTSENVHDIGLTFSDVFQSSFMKQLIIINLIIYYNIVLNERGVYVLEKYCKEYDVKPTKDSYKDMLNFLQGFFDRLNTEQHCIELEKASKDDMQKMFDIKKSYVEEFEKNKKADTTAETSKNSPYSKSTEQSLNSEQENVKSLNKNWRCLAIFKNEIQDFLNEKNVDIDIAAQTFEFLQSHEKATQQDITNYIFETVDRDDFNSETTALKIETHLNKMFMQDLLDFNEPYYELTQNFIDIVKEAEAHVVE